MRGCQIPGQSGLQSLLYISVIYRHYYLQSYFKIFRFEQLIYIFVLKIDIIDSFSHVFYKNVLDVQLLLVNFASGAHFFDNSD